LNLTPCDKICLTAIFTREGVRYLVLEKIIEKVKKGERVFESWAMLKNVYFRGPTGWEDLKEWADKHDMVATPTDIIEESFDTKLFKTVMFYPKSHQ
jgi:hypothetical protein